MQALQADGFSMKASKWPTGFYELYDPKDTSLGLFRNYIVIQASSTRFDYEITIHLSLVL